MKILHISKYRYKNNMFVPDIFNVRRFVILLAFILTCIVGLIVTNLDNIVIRTPHAETLSVGSYKKVANTTYNPTKEEIGTKRTLSALESYISKSNIDLSNNLVKDYSFWIFLYAKEFNVDPFLIAGLINVESKFERYAVSSVGALGLTQVLPKWHKEKIVKLRDKFGHLDLFNPEHSIAMGTMIFAEYKKKSKGSREKALLRYNGSLHHTAPKYAKWVMKERKAAKKHEVSA